jgi:hypothetical protein
MLRDGGVRIGTMSGDGDRIEPGAFDFLFPVTKSQQIHCVVVGQRGNPSPYEESLV